MIRFGSIDPNDLEEEINRLGITASRNSKKSWFLDGAREDKSLLGPVQVRSCWNDEDGDHFHVIFWVPADKDPSKWHDAFDHLKIRLRTSAGGYKRGEVNHSRFDGRTIAMTLPGLGKYESFTLHANVADSLTKSA